ncbi:MAG: 50S ribosomal protein L10 [Chlamydiae bacterium]|nr:50S ribosomal protein L10 [Chlamydiota bacterium]
MRQEKQLLLDEINDKIEGSSSFVLTRYQGLNPDLSSDFRLSLAESGSTYAAVKKRILVKAIEAKGIQLDKEQLAGHIGVAFASSEPISMAKVLFAFAKENKDTLEIIGGHFDGRFCSASEMKTISELPSKDEMRAEFLGLLEAPMSQTLSVMDALLTSILFCLENKKEQE